MRSSFCPRQYLPILLLRRARPNFVRIVGMTHNAGYPTANIGRSGKVPTGPRPWDVSRSLLCPHKRMDRGFAVRPGCASLKPHAAQFVIRKRAPGPPTLPIFGARASGLRFSQRLLRGLLPFETRADFVLSSLNDSLLMAAMFGLSRVVCREFFLVVSKLLINA